MRKASKAVSMKLNSHLPLTFGLQTLFKVFESNACKFTSNYHTEKVLKSI